MSEVKRGRGRPRKPEGPLSATERSRLHRQRRLEELELLKDELAFVKNFAGDDGPQADDQDAPVNDEIERLKELDRRWQVESRGLAVVVTRLLNKLAVIDLTTAQTYLADPFVSEILTKWGLLPAQEPQVCNRDHHGGFAESDVVGTLTTKTASRLESLIVVPEGDKAKD